MKRFAVLLAAAGLVLTSAVPAYAATGTLVLSGQTIENPSGCYNAQRWPLIVQNDTDEPALIFNAPNCTGAVIQVVPPGGSATSEFGVSVYIA
ncbi:hypothetical protein ACFO4E_03690 [Nocardiopsis mangrovi]|uniref:Secreted protein n=1 Tax=Nocardiopsis mangrovi TaxID=1179818 RepID=A0ABV9DQ07_9ACTN